MSTQNIKAPEEGFDRVRLPSYRHAAPSSPWPWIDLEDAVDPEQLECIAPPIPELCDHSPERCDRCWTRYPQSLFPNWTEVQVRKAKIYDAIHSYSKTKPCICYRLDVDDHGVFTRPKEVVVAHGDEDRMWDYLVREQRPPNTRLRALFIENLSGPTLQMLGTKYKIEPFFWSSSLNWIPSRFQDEIQDKVGDHITITLTFLHSISTHDAVEFAAKRSTDSVHDVSKLLGSQSIDTHAPLNLYSNQRLLVLDLLSVHLVRNINGSTIISYHPAMNIPVTTAKFLHERIRYAGQSAYWQRMFQKSQDPTFVLLIFIWHTMYAWDEALENLYEHICSLESRAISNTEMPPTRELHIVRAYHLHYMSLLNHYTKHVTFIKNTPNPALDGLSEEDRICSAKLLHRECDNLINETERLSSELSMQERRLKNVLNLVSAEASVRDNSTMKLFSSLTMFFLPASFVAGIFGMNVGEINPGTKGTVTQYLVFTLSLTVVTAWIIIGFQSKYIFPPETSFIKRLVWPVILIRNMISKKGTPPVEEKEEKFDYYP